MTFLEAVAVILVPAIPLVLPGIGLVRAGRWQTMIGDGARISLWSLALLTVFFTLGLIFGVPVLSTMILLLAFTVVRLLFSAPLFSRSAIWHLLTIALLLLVASSAYIIPFLFIHDGLPTGDVQKAIIWAQQIIQTNHLPQYSDAIAQLNRDPVDFYTPGLHAVSAFVMAFSPAPLTSIGIFSIFMAVATVWIAAAVANEIFDKHPHPTPSLFAFLITLTQFRFLRYLREPGYHFQNIAGELFLFGLLLLFIRITKYQKRGDIALFIFSSIALFLTHQFSTFIGVFMIAGMFLSVLLQQRANIASFVKKNSYISILFTACATLLLLFLFSIGLAKKIPAIFTTHPHLLSSLPSFADYPALMGTFWFTTGVAGLILMLIEARKNNAHFREVLLFTAGVVPIALLSQGPALGVDIPPVRALFYLAVPLSITGSYFFSKVFYVVRHAYSGLFRMGAQAVVFAALVIPMGASVFSAYGSLSHTVRTNSTLTPEEFALAQYIEVASSPTDGILIDDYNRRSASWLVLAHRPMFTRIASDLQQQMEESKQSQLRQELYFHQLDYEKVISLGSLPEIGNLLAQRSITYIAGVTGSSAPGLSHNPILETVGAADDIVLFKHAKPAPACTSPTCAFLIRRATLANDIGDPTDTFEHAQASIRTPLLSESKSLGNTTYRETSSSIIPLSFNVGDYVRTIWDPNHTGTPESKLTFMLRLTRPIAGLSITLPDGSSLPLPASSEITVAIPSNKATISDDGFIRIVIQNPRAQTIGIDLIALGPSLVP